MTQEERDYQEANAVQKMEFVNSLCAAVGSLLIVLLCSAYGGQVRDELKQPSVQGMWLRNLGEIRRVVPTGDGRTSWAIVLSGSPDAGLLVIDEFGEIKKKTEIPRDVWNVDSDSDLVLKPAPATNYAWVFLNKTKHVFHVSTDGTAKEVGPFVVGSDRLESSVLVSPDGRTAWTGGPDESNIASYTAEGRSYYSVIPEATSISQGKHTLVLSAASDSEHAWMGVVLEGASDLKSPRRAWLYIVDRRAQAEDAIHAIYDDVDLGKQVFTAKGKYSVIPSKTLGFYCIREDGFVFNNGKPLLGDRRVHDLVAPDGSNSVW